MSGHWEDSKDAWKVLEDRGYTEQRFCITPPQGHEPTPDELEAINYLCDEWTWEYKPRETGRRETVSDEQINHDMHAMFGAAERAEKRRLDRIAELEKQLADVRGVLNEIDCRIEHGAESGGHLEYVRDKLRSIL